MMESIIKDKILEDMVKITCLLLNNMASQRAYFVLPTALNCWIKSLEEGCSVDTDYLFDFAKAFAHICLLTKLE